MANKAGTEGAPAGIWLKRTARISAWALLACVVVLAVSGWGITQTGVIYNITFGLIDRGMANAIHRAAGLPLAFFFLLHVLISIRLKLTSRRPSVVWLVNAILVAAGSGILWIFIYMEYFRLGG